MIVYDREGYSNDFMLDMWEERISVCTYNKYVKDKWDEAEFREYEVQKEHGGTQTIKLAERLVFIQGKESEKLWMMKSAKTRKSPARRKNHNYRKISSSVRKN